LDGFLDPASLSNVSHVCLIRGMGKLKPAVAGFLKNRPHVEKRQPGMQDEGGTGATIAELKE
jgi:dsDNA-specific endonuclease/ATPase MutS2